MKIKVVSLPASVSSDNRIIEEYKAGIAEGADCVVVSTCDMIGQSYVKDFATLALATTSNTIPLITNDFHNQPVTLANGKGSGSKNGFPIPNTTIDVVFEARIMGNMSFPKSTGLNTLYVNMLGYSEQYVSDGKATLIINGKTIHGKEFIEAGTMFDTDAVATVASEDDRAVTYRALVFGLREYMRSNRFKSVVLGYSGGVDSGLVAAIACDAIGPENVHLVRLPSKYSSQHSLHDAKEGAKRLGAPMRTISIEGVVSSIRAAYSDTEYHYEGQTENELTGISDENIQARARAILLMAISNQEHRLLLSTGNKSEVAVGYGTLYGDMAGGFNPIKDCYKTLVWELCRWRNGVSQTEAVEYGFAGFGGIEVVPEAIITKAPSAELRPDQKDSDSLPDYFELDEQIEQFLNHKEVPERIKKLILGAEFKRRQAAPGIRITNRMFGVDNNYPLVR